MPVPRLRGRLAVGAGIAALGIIRAGAARVVEVSEDKMQAGIRILHEDTHNLAEGAGAAALAALNREAAEVAGQQVVVADRRQYRSGLGGVRALFQHPAAGLSAPKVGFVQP